MTAEEMRGGNQTAYVARLGDTVRRSRGPGAGRASQILTALEELHYPFAPRYFGIDADDRDVLSFLPGDTTSHPLERSEDSYAAAARMLRLLHDLTAGHALATGGECLVHGDAGPYNTIFDDEGMPLAFIDWDSAGPGQRLVDLSFLGWTWCIQARGNVDPTDQARRLASVRDAYGLDVEVDFVAAVMDRQIDMTSASKRLLGVAGHETAYYERHQAVLDWATSDRDVILNNRQIFAKALAP